ncbi:amidase [Alteribacillus persepolensis]|uniref:Amidase n=1 Tax=Alteribacillus persepolensis TaxID=568899 RepID=A0A1G8HR15_9BACI|nr:amidase family protein [Alteribacillus persepolensis]SDI08931.1 amidase [Alteribacillus persepolensis]
MSEKSVYKEINIKKEDKTELWQWSASELVRAIKARKISSREVVESSLARIEQVNPKLNALVEVYGDEALLAADQADQAVHSGKNLGPLHGVPTSIKINSDEKGKATTNGVAAFKENIAAEDAPHVANLRKAGAIFIGRNNSPAFSYRWFTNNDVHGMTFNPWDKSKTPGGSSGGAAAAVAAGMLPIAQGNDIGGSVRYPAYASGISGLRPTAGRVPSQYGPVDQDQPLSVQTMLTQGPLARTVDDLRLALQALSPFDPRDPIHASVPLVGDSLRKPIRVGLLKDVNAAKPAPAVDKALDDAAAKLADAGYVVEEVDLPLFEEAYKLWYLLCMEEFRQMMPLVNEVGDHGMKTAAEHYYAVAEDWWGPSPGLTEYMNGYARRGTLISKLQEFLIKYPILLMPVSAEQAFEQNADITSVENMRRVMAAQWSMMAVPLLGFPALSISTSVENGLPVGVQLLGRRFREDTIFDAAEVLEAHSKVQTPLDPAW